MKNNKISSYSSAGTFPVKLLQCQDLVDVYQRIRPIHIQLNLTNKCNLKCSFCSCQNRDQTIELDFDKAKKIVNTYKELGCQAVTITGGGEPTLYKKLPEIIKLFSQVGIKIGLVTNGININNVLDLNMLTWIRVSFDDSRHFNRDFKHNLISASTINHKVDWSFSYVVTKSHDFGQIIRVVEFANSMCFTHVRLVSDLLDLDNVVDMDEVKIAIKQYVKDDKVIYQGRKAFTRGRQKCLISLLKPVITVEGDIYPCCVEENETIPVLSNNIINNKFAKDVNVGDFCLTPEGNFEVKEKFEKNKNETYFITLKNGKSIKVSKDHLFFVCNNYKLSNKRDYLLNSYSFDLKKASELKIGDLLPTMYRLQNINIDNESNYNISTEMARILGYYSAEGWKDKKNSIGFMFNKNELIKEDLKKCLNKENIKFTVYTRRTGEQIMVYSKLNKIVDIFECGNESLNKSIPCIIFNSNDKIKKEYLRAYIAGDGCVYKPTKNYNGFKVQLSTISRKLASDLVLLLNQLCIEPTIYLEKREGKHFIENREVNVRDIYRVKISGYYNLEKIKEILGVNIYRGKKSQKRALANPKNNSMMLLPIKNIEIIKGGNFVDFKVINSRFCSGLGSIMVHNCGVQYAKKSNMYDYDETMKMGTIDDAQDIFFKQDYFNGHYCDICYYDEYNIALDNITSDLNHLEFV